MERGICPIAGLYLLCLTLGRFWGHNLDILVVS